MIERQPHRAMIKTSLIAGGITLCFCMIGLIEAFDQRFIISDMFTLGQLLLFSAAAVAGFLTTRQKNLSTVIQLLYGAIAGLLTGIPPFLLILLTLWWENIRQAFINVSPGLIEIITFGRPNPVVGGLLLILAFVLIGLLGALFGLLPRKIRSVLLTGAGWTIGTGIMSEIIIGILRSRLSSVNMRILFGNIGLQFGAFVVLFVLITLFSFWWQRSGGEQYHRIRTAMPARQMMIFNRITITLLFLFLLILPSILGIYLSEIFNNVGLYILMGLGLNIAVGLAGLLDLGYVTNFAVGAYIMALLTSNSAYGLSEPISFWMAVPICVMAAMLTGFVFALPVLRMRGDYLAIATLGFGEIVRILARSDALKAVIGGAQGILQIPQAQISGIMGQIFSTIVTPINRLLSSLGLGIISADGGTIVFGTPPQLYYLLLLACLLMLFISQRLNNSRVGRRWMAIREDEDVAAAMGINTTNAKVVAFTLSAASGGLAGALFAAKLGSIFPHSFQLLISINVLSLIIVGGIGSIPGVIVGAFALIGIPELLREFAEFRLLLYGIALIVMMLIRPEGLWPSEVQRRELQRPTDDSPDTAPYGSDLDVPMSA